MAGGRLLKAVRRAGQRALAVTPAMRKIRRRERRRLMDMHVDQGGTKGPRGEPDGGRWCWAHECGNFAAHVVVFSMARHGLAELSGMTPKEWNWQQKLAVCAGNFAIWWLAMLCKKVFKKEADLFYLFAPLVFFNLDVAYVKDVRLSLLDLALCSVLVFSNLVTIVWQKSKSSRGKIYPQKFQTEDDAEEEEEEEETFHPTFETEEELLFVGEGGQFFQRDTVSRENIRPVA